MLLGIGTILAQGAQAMLDQVDKTDGCSTI